MIYYAYYLIDTYFILLLLINSIIFIFNSAAQETRDRLRNAVLSLRLFDTARQFSEPPHLFGPLPITSLTRRRRDSGQPAAVAALLTSSSLLAATQATCPTWIRSCGPHPKRTPAWRCCYCYYGYEERRTSLRRGRDEETYENHAHNKHKLSHIYTFTQSTHAYIYIYIYIYI